MKKIDNVKGRYNCSLICKLVSSPFIPIYSVKFLGWKPHFLGQHWLTAKDVKKLLISEVFVERHQGSSIIVLIEKVKIVNDLICY